MAKRYRPHAPFSVDVKGVPRTFNPDYIDRTDGLPGYPPEMLVGLTKQQKASFHEFDIEGGPIEKTTAAPGERRSVKRPTTTKK